MALVKQTVIDKIEIVGQFKALQIREANQIMEDGQIISSSFHRYVLQPNADITEQPADIQAIANVVWTDEIKSSYAQHVADQQPTA